MAPRTSNRTLRIRGISCETSIDKLVALIEPALSAPSRRSYRNPFASSAASTPDQLTYSFSQQDTLMTSTVSFATADMKIKMVKQLVDNHVDWKIDDHFAGLTVLSASDNVDIDVCAVHGLGGNAFDTWMGSSKMWLRDLLPKSAPFDRSRIMTFGYDSSLVNRKSQDRIRDWADDLLRQVGYVRTTEKDQSRPIMFICHSLGGLVGREALWRLSTQADKFNGIQLHQCGLIFLSTPHSGTTQADWNDFLVNLSELAFGVRSHEIVDELRSFSHSSVDSAENFSSMVPKPPFHCFCEGESTSVAGRNRVIVTQASAGFCGQVAEKILGVDHRSICKFDTTFDGYMPVLAQLKRIRAMLIMRGASESQKVPNVPGQPSIEAPHYPLNKQAKWYEGADLHNTSQLVGRADKLEEIINSLQVQDIHRPKIIALTGIGGIGKTEILLEIALLHRNVSNVFFIKARDLKSLESTLLEIATSIGHDILSTKFSHLDLAAIWRSYGPSERVLAFKSWLGHPSNQGSLFIVDDLDGYKDETLIKAALPREAQIILYSTRDSSLIESLDRDSQSYHIPTMKDDEMASLMTMTVRKISGILASTTLSEGELKAIAKVVCGHALGACRAVSYILRVLAQQSDDAAKVFLEVFNGQNWESRLRFLEYKPSIGLSIMETFVISLDRIHRHRLEVERFLELFAFINDRDHKLNFRDFLRSERPWLQELQPILPDYDVFASGLGAQSEYLAELENVSIGIRPDVLTPLQIHPLWLECVQQRAGHEGRARWIRQIILICRGSYIRNEEQSDSLRPFIENCCAIAARFRIGLDELFESSELRAWVHDLNKNLEDFPDESSSTSKSSDNSEAANTVEISAPEAVDDAPQANPKLFEDMAALQISCNEAAQALVSLNNSKMSEEVFTSWRQRYTTLLRRLKSLEDSGRDLLQVKVLHLEVYDVLLRMAPKFEQLNPSLGYLLRRRRTEVQQRRSHVAEGTVDWDRG